MKAAKTPKKLKEIPCPPQKEAFKMKRKYVLHYQRRMLHFLKLLQNV